MSSDLEAELANLRIAFELEKEQRIKLEEECDLLAFDNDRLNGELARLKAIVDSHNLSVGVTSKLNVDGSAVEAGSVEIFIEGDNQYANALSLKVLDANGGKNVLCTNFLSSGEHEIMLSGGVDQALNGFDHSGVRLFSYKMPGPVLAIDVHQQTIACSMMDGSLAVVCLLDEEEDYSQHPVAFFKDHSKYVVAVRFSSNGDLLATASHDKSVNIYKWSSSASEFQKMKTVQFTNTPESLVFIATTATSTDSTNTTTTEENKTYELVIGVRGVPHLVYLDCVSFEQRLVSLNEHDWDTHVSFAPLHLSTSPDEKLLLVATDKNLHYVYKTGTNERVRILAGHSCGDYGKPVVAWDCTGKYIYCNSEEDSVVYIYSLTSEKIVGKLSKHGHKGIVRGVACHPTKRLVVSASYDKTIILWSHQDGAVAV